MLKQLQENPRRTMQLGGLLLAILAINSLAGNPWIAGLGLWIVPTLTILYWHQTRVWRGLPLLLLVHWLPTSILWQGVTPFFGISHHIFMAVNTLIALSPYLIDRWLVLRSGPAGQRPFLTTLIFPAAAVAFEFLIVFGSPLGTFGAAGYSQIVFPALTQMVAVTGLLGITFISSWFASTAAWAWENRQQGRPVIRGITIVVGLLVIIVVAGFIRLNMNRAATTGEGVQIASFTAAEWDPHALFPLLDEDIVAFRSETRSYHAAYLEQTVTAAEDGAQLVVWPEGALIGVPEDVQTAVAEAQTLARDYGIYIAAPTFELFPGTDRVAENRMLIIDAEGNVVLNHVKYGGNFLEGTLAGSKELQTVETPFGTLSAIICWDADFPGTIRQAGQAGVDVMIISARDWEEIVDLHAEMATYRGIENGMTIVRQADQGRSLISDPYGRILTTANHFEPGGKMITAAVDVRSAGTAYAQMGDLLGWLSVIGLIALGSWVFLAGRSKAADPAPELAADF